MNVERMILWQWNWPALFLGCAVTLALATLILVIAGMAGASPLRPYMAAEMPSEYSIGWTLFWLLFVTLAPAFAGAWLTGYFTRPSGKLAALEAIVMWTISAVLLLAGLLTLAGWRPRAPIDTETRIAIADPEFRRTLSSLIKKWSPTDPVHPVYATEDTLKAAARRDPSSDSILREFVQKNSRLNQQQISRFLTSQEVAITAAKENALHRARAHGEHSVSEIDRIKNRQRAVTITLVFALAASLVLAIAGVHAGGSVRFREDRLTI